MNWEEFFATIGVIATAFVLFVIAAAAALIVYFAREDRRLARREERRAVNEAERWLRNRSTKQQHNGGNH